MMLATAPVEQWVKHTFRAMGTQVTVSAQSAPGQVGNDVQALFGQVERCCTRFDSSSDLSRVNRAPDEEHAVAPECAAVIEAAHRAYLETDGLFDPRILSALVDAGYDRTFDELTGGEPREPRAGHETTSVWQPRVDAARGTVQVGEHPIDLGGIGKGWTVDAAGTAVAKVSDDFLVNAGGDLVVRGDGPTGDGWTVGVEDPHDLTLTIAVLRVHDAACATSCTTKRSWRSADSLRHHLIDPRTGRPATGGVASVTVVADSVTQAETWSKALLLSGEAEIESLASSHELAALWVLDGGRTQCSRRMIPHVAWHRE